MGQFPSKISILESSPGGEERGECSFLEGARKRYSIERTHEVKVPSNVFETVMNDDVLHFERGGGTPLESFHLNFSREIVLVKSFP